MAKLTNNSTTNKPPHPEPVEGQNPSNPLIRGKTKTTQQQTFILSLSKDNPSSFTLYPSGYPEPVEGQNPFNPLIRGKTINS